MSDRVGDLWRSYERDVMPDDAGPNQRTETRRAFYAGVTSILGLMTIQLSPDREPTRADLSMMDEIADELVAFNNDVAEGRA